MGTETLKTTPDQEGQEKTPNLWEKFLALPLIKALLGSREKEPAITFEPTQRRYPHRPSSKNRGR